MYCLFFFFTGPPATELYSYLHTLFLHDALPTYERSPRRTRWVCTPATARIICMATRSGPIFSSVRKISVRPSRTARSEEHTSELQSLMRSSYAVFCLKKKKHRDTEHQIVRRQRNAMT